MSSWHSGALANHLWAAGTGCNARGLLTIKLMHSSPHTTDLLTAAWNLRHPAVIPSRTPRCTVGSSKLGCPKLRRAAPGVCRRAAHAGPGLLGGPVGLGGCLPGPAGPRCVLPSAHPMQADGLRQARPAGGLCVRCGAPQLRRACLPARAPAARCCWVLSWVLVMPVSWLCSSSCLGHSCMHPRIDARLADVCGPPAGLYGGVQPGSLSRRAWQQCNSEKVCHEQGN